MTWKSQKRLKKLHTIYKDVKCVRKIHLARPYQGRGIRMLLLCLSGKLQGERSQKQGDLLWGDPDNFLPYFYLRLVLRGKMSTLPLPSNITQVVELQPGKKLNTGKNTC